MTHTVEMPIWALALLIVFAAVTFASHFLFPSVRWFFRKRMERVVARLNQRLERPIEPFKLARRYDMIQRLIYDPEVTQAVVDHAKAKGIPENVAFEQARSYAREIVPGFSATAYFSIAIRLAKWLSWSLYRVRLGHISKDALSDVDKDATVVFVMNHRSNMDYVLVTWLAAERSALSYAVGEWAQVWPLNKLIKAMGAYFIRRHSRNDLYRRVLARYVGLATDGGVTQAMFPEGGLTLTGKLDEPKLGLLKYIVEGRTKSERDVVFIPVALNYDRVFEDRVLVSAGARGDRRFPARISVIALSILRQIGLSMIGKYHRHGYAAASFGAPVSLNAFEAEHGGENIQGLAELLMKRIGDEVPILPVPMVARILGRADGPLTRQQIEAEVVRIMELLPQTLVHLSHDTPQYAVESGVRELLRRDLLREEGDRLALVAEERPIVAYYAASIEHLFRIRSEK